MSETEVPLAERVQVWGLALVTVVTTVLAIVVVFGGADADDEAVDAGSTSEAGEPEPQPDATPSEATDPAEPGELTASEPTEPAAPDDPIRVVVIGDEWAGGAGATPIEAYPKVAESLLDDWRVNVDSVEGSGWTNSGPTVPLSRFADRAGRLNDGAAAPDVIVFSAQTPAGSPLREVAEGIDDAVEAVRTQVPDAISVVVLPVANKRSDALCPASLADADDVVCINTFADGWLRPGQRDLLINPADNAPNTAGHERLGELLADELRALDLS